jgi:hypothetical protein
VPSVIKFSELATGLRLPHLHTLEIIHRGSGVSVVRNFFHGNPDAFTLPPSSSPSKKDIVPPFQAIQPDSPFPSLATLAITPGSLLTLVDAARLQAPIVEIRGLPFHLVQRFPAVKESLESFKPTLRKIVFGAIPPAETLKSEAGDCEEWIKDVLPCVEMSHAGVV